MQKLNKLMNDAAFVFNSTEWRQDSDGYFVKDFGDSVVYLHRFIAEKALGKPLPVGAEVHHYNGNKFDNRNFNLVVCQDAEYHALLHERAKKVFEEDVPYAAIKKASWEHRERIEASVQNREIKPYKTVAARKAAILLASLEKRDWWHKVKTEYSWPFL